MPVAKTTARETTPPLPAIGETKVYHTADGAPYVICNSKEDFVNPTADSSKSSKDVNDTLNLNLGQSILTRDNRLGCAVLFFSYWVDVFFIQWWESVAMYVYSDVIPFSLKKNLIKYCWKFYVRVHQTILGKKTGLHPSQSFEYHAITTLMFPSQFMAWTPRRMRFFLGQLSVNAPNPPPTPERIRVINDSMAGTVLKEIPRQQANHCKVQGWYISRTSSVIKELTKSKGVIFWIYGGAYLSGDVRGTSSVADWVCQRTECDAVFLPQFRLAPEADLFDVMWDVCLAMCWLQTQLKSTSDGLAPPIYVMGVSSGGAIAARLLQLIAKHKRGEALDVPDYFHPLLSQLDMSCIQGAVLFGPYVDYEQLYEHERRGSFVHYAKHDLVVNRAVQEYGLPFLRDFIPTLEIDITGDVEKDNRSSRRKQSPLHHSCKGLPPLFILASEHEAVYDTTCELVNRARSDGVDATFGVYKYMCHVFALLYGFLPEAQLAMNTMVDWVKRQQDEYETRASK